MGRAIMVQGTASHVGKSVLVAGLCRLFRQEGLSVAPFKAQNMALNSFATPDGLEIGRAQAVQAEAAGVAPTADMNPILLKPEGNARSQVVVQGRVLGTMDAWEYHRRTPELWPIVEASLRRLLAAHDIVVIEGAGSPVEVNLRHMDIVNMRVAEAVSAPVLLVADIDRGGVFAALVGTMELLEPSQRELVAGFVINKFRGDPSLFDEGVVFLEERLARPVLGVVPWIEGLGIAEEDSLGLPVPIPVNGAAPRAPRIDVAVIRLPHISNFDDFDPLAIRPGVRLRYVDRVADFGHPDLVILPGTKTTRTDLEFLRERALDRAVLSHAAGGGAIVGICGGYQMLGERIEDPDGVEGIPGCSEGLGLLPSVTWYATRKATHQVRGRVESALGPLAAASGTLLSAYEIHMGRTESRGTAPFSTALFSIEDGSSGPRPEGIVSADGRIVGTYLHGLFRNGPLLDALVEWLADRKGIVLPSSSVPADPYDRLAETLRATLDIDRLRALVGILAVSRD